MRDRFRIWKFIAIGFLCAVAQAQAQDEAQKPAYKSGETWVFSVKEGGSIGSTSRTLNGTYELTLVAGKIKIVSVDGAEKSEVEPRPNALLGLLGVARNLKFPLAVGKKWTADYKNRPVGGKETPRTITYEVKGVEDVATPAGTFRAFKLESDDRGPFDYWTTTYWYSPQTRSIVKSVFDASSGGRNTGLQREIELLKAPAGD